MIRYGIIATILILLAAAVTATFRSGEPVETPDFNGVAISTFEVGDDLQQRLSLLEAAIREERTLRAELENTVAGLVAQNQRLMDLVSSNSETQRVTSVTNSPGGTSSDQQATPEPNQPILDAQARQIARLKETGFDEYRATEIVRLSEELEMQWLSAQYAASQGEPIQGDLRYELAEKFKSSLGEADFEKYLVANRQPTSVAINNVFASSPAQVAGLQQGDEITRYDGERVYNILELNRMTQTRDASGHVEVEVIRNGQSILLSLPSGPMGISSSSRPGVLSSERGF